MSHQDDVIFETEIGAWGIGYIFFWVFMFIICAASCFALVYPFWILGEAYFYNRPPPSLEISGVAIALIVFVLYLFFIPSIMIPINTLKYFSRRPLFRLTKNSIWDARLSPPEISADKILSIHVVMNKFGEPIGLRIQVENQQLYKQSIFWTAFLNESFLFFKKPTSICISLFETKRSKNTLQMMTTFADANDIPLTSGRTNQSTIH